MKYILILLFSVLTFTSSYGQCSDSGICTIGAHKEKMDSQNTQNHTLGVAYSFALSGEPYDVTYNTVNLSGEFAIGESMTGSVSIPYLFQSIKDGNSVNGFGDAIVSLSRSFELGDAQNVILHLGTKLPLSLVEKNNFKFLNGYGTFDLLPGATFSFESFSAGIAAQIPLTKYTDDVVEYSRGLDILLQFAYRFNLADWNFRIQNFNIKRINKSEMLVKGVGEVSPHEIPDSDFTQVNLLLGAEKKINEKMTIDLSAAFPFLERKENSDGTQRALTVGVGVKYSL